jgi:hypothetical protein
MKSAPDSSTIDLNSASSIAHWTKELNCTEAQLHGAVATVGTQVADVRKQLDHIPYRRV